MILHFYLRYSTKFGQTMLVSGNTAALGNNDLSRAFSLEYLNEQLWHGSVEIDPKLLEGPLNYKYILHDEKEEEILEFGDDRIVDLQKVRAEKIIFTDTWNHAGLVENVFFTAAFQDVLLKAKRPGSPVSKKEIKNHTHEFRVKAAPSAGRSRFGAG